jgi:hypothetical protein
MKDLIAKPLVNRVEAKIRALFLEGVPLTPDVCQYIEATLGAAEPDALADLLAGPDESERDTLLELVFFPDQGFQYSLEKVLAGGGLAEADRSRLAIRLRTDPARACLRLPGHPQKLDSQLPIEGVEAFLTRLNLPWSLDARLRAALDQWAVEHGGKRDIDGFHLMVKLRNADLLQTPGQLGVLKDFLRRMPPAEQRWVICFDFLLAFLTEHGDVLNFYRALMDRKLFLVRHLIKARRNAETISRSNMETLCLTGFRAAHFDMAAAEEALGCIDAIALAVYGRTEYFDDAPVSMDLGQVGGADDIEGIVRRLS